MTLTEAETAARAEIRAGFALAYCTDYTRETGCRVFLQTDQGWNPDPFWQERTGPGRPGGADDSLTD
jgi:hypothetical protein